MYRDIVEIVTMPLRPTRCNCVNVISFVKRNYTGTYNLLNEIRGLLKSTSGN